MAWHWYLAKSQISWNRSRFSRGKGVPLKLAWVHLKQGRTSRGNHSICFCDGGLGWWMRQTTWATMSGLNNVQGEAGWMPIHKMGKGTDGARVSQKAPWLVPFFPTSIPNKLRWRQKSKQTRAKTSHLLLIEANLEDSAECENQLISLTRQTYPLSHRRYERGQASWREEQNSCSL